MTRQEPLLKAAPRLTDVFIASGHEEKEFSLLQLRLKKGRNILLGEAIVKGAEEREISLGKVVNFRSIPGKGIEAYLEEKRILLGTRKLMEENGISFKELEAKMREFEENGKTAMLVASGDEIIGLVAVADTIKENSKDAIETLNKNGHRSSYDNRG